MNPNDVLGNLANGVSVCNTGATLDPSVLTALANAVTTQKSVTSIGRTAPTNAIDLKNLSSDNVNMTEFTFTNNTTQTVIYWFTTEFYKTGEPTIYGENTSAVDFPLANGSDNNGNGFIENGGAKLYFYNNFVANLRSGIVTNITIETPQGLQSRESLILRTDYITANNCSSNRLAPFCSACNNDNSTTFVAEFRCPIPVGMGHSFGYSVRAGVSVTVRVTTGGIPIDSYISLGMGDCGC